MRFGESAVRALELFGDGEQFAVGAVGGVDGQ